MKIKSNGEKPIDIKIMNFNECKIMIRFHFIFSSQKNEFTTVFIHIYGVLHRN